MQQKEEKI